MGSVLPLIDRANPSAYQSWSLRRQLYQHFAPSGTFMLLHYASLIMLINCYIRYIYDVKDYQFYTDQDLISLLKDNSQFAFTQIYDRYQGLLFIYACKITQNESEAEDIVQEVLFYLWDKRNVIIFESSLSSYLYSAVRYKFFNLLDRKKVRVNYAESFQAFIDQDSVQADYMVRERELSVLIEKEIALLPKKMRKIFELSRKQHFSHKEIAEKLGISEKTVKNQVNNALKSLRVKLGLLLFFIFLLK
jgi:RNA polymerase sigma-70 factor (family 1)